MSEGHQDRLRDAYDQLFCWRMVENRAKRVWLDTLLALYLATIVAGIVGVVWCSVSNTVPPGQDLLVGWVLLACVVCVVALRGFTATEKAEHFQQMSDRFLGVCFDGDFEAALPEFQLAVDKQREAALHALKKLPFDFLVAKAIKGAERISSGTAQQGVMERVKDQIARA